MEGKILLVCRDEKCRNKLVKLLKSSNMSVHIVAEDADTLLKVLESHYDLVIYDLENSNLDGLKMVKILRKVRPKVSLLVISNDPSKQLGGKILQEGVAYYAVKPINLEVIKEAVVTALQSTKW